MVLAIIFLALGFFLLLNALGVVSGSFWGLFWAIVFLAIGFRLLVKRGTCPICGWHGWEAKMHEKIHQKTDKFRCGSKTDGVEEAETRESDS